MKITKNIAKDPITGIESEVWTVVYKTSEKTVLEAMTDVPETSMSYCYDGTDKGKTKFFNGTAWVEQ